MTFVSLIILLMTVETSGDDSEIGIDMKWKQIFLVADPQRGPMMTVRLQD